MENYILLCFYIIVILLLFVIGEIIVKIFVWINKRKQAYLFSYKL